MQEKPKLVNQIMAPIPTLRFKEPLQVFTKTGLNFAGLFIIK